MKRILIIFVLILAGCQPETDCRQNHYHMQFSEALPVKYYRNGVETYNQKAICGVEKRCWYDPWNCSDRISSQFVHDEEGEYLLQIVDNLLNEVTRIPFTPTGVNNMGMPSFDEWTQAGSGSVWVLGYNPTTTLPNTGPSNDLVAALANVPAGTYTFRYRITTQTTAGNIVVKFFKESVEIFTTSLTALSIAGSNTGSFSVTLDEAPDEVKVILVNSGVSTNNVTANRVWMAVPGTEWTYDLDLIPENLSPSLCNQDVAFRVISESIVKNGKFTINEDWTNVGVGGGWTIEGSTASVTFLGSGQSSRDFTQDLVDGKGDSISYDGDVEIEAIVEQDATTDNVFFTVELGSTAFTFSTLGKGLHTFTDSDTGVPSFNQIRFRAASPSTGGKSIRVRSLKITVAGEVVMYYHTDPQSIRTSHPCTQLVEYWDSEDFKGLVYENGSPQRTFQKRFFADFWQDEEAITEELHTLSDGTLLTLSTEMEKKRFWRLDWSPNYVARIFGYILMHQYVYVDNLYWKKKDTIERTKTKNLSLVTLGVLLTESDIDRNVF